MYLCLHHSSLYIIDMELSHGQLLQEMAYQFPISSSSFSPVVNGPTISTIVRRPSANYKPSNWDYDFLQSLGRDHKVEKYTTRIKKLREDVEQLLREENNLLSKMELIDAVQRLGLGYLFEKEIKVAIKTIITSSVTNAEMKEDLHSIALQFRLLRQHGHTVSSDVFNFFKDEIGGFKASLCKNIKGLLSLYEASHLSYQGENILEEAKAFAILHLKEIKEHIDPALLKKVQHALELPLHWRMIRLEARWFIDTYEREEGMNPLLLELAKLEFNKVQTLHQINLKNLSRWWKDLGLSEKWSFSRDRLVESFLWTIGKTFEPQFEHSREVITKVDEFITIIDDVYDAYSSIDELQLFTDAVDRWDLEAMEQLPEFLKIGFLAFYNTINQVAYDSLKEQGLNVIPYLKKVWADLCRAYLTEAKWYHNGYKPMLEEYLQNAWISISGPVVFTHIYCSLGEKITMEGLNEVASSPIVKWSSMIVRLCNDLGTSTDELARGDVPKSIQCYMAEAGVSEPVARDHIKSLIAEAWKKLNECSMNSPFPPSFVNAVINSARTGQFIYQHGDGHGAPSNEDTKRVKLLLLEPIPLVFD